MTVDFLDDDVDRDRLDLEHVPPELLEHDGEVVHLLDDDYVADGVLCVFPELLRPRRRPSEDAD